MLDFAALNSTMKTLSYAEADLRGLIHYGHDFNFLGPFFDAAGNWIGPAYSGLDIETEVYLKENGRRAGLNPVDGDIATVQIQLNSDCWVVQIPAGQVIGDLPGIGHFINYLTNINVVKCIHNAVFEQSWLIYHLGEWLQLAPVHDTQVGEYDLAEGRSTTSRRLEYIVPSPKNAALADAIKLQAELKKTKRQLDDSDDEGEDEGVDDYLAGYVRARQELSLGKSILRWYGVNLDKDHDLRTSFKRGDSLTDRQIRYAASDSFWTQRLALDQLVEMRKREATLGSKILSVFKLDCEYTEAVARMRIKGMPVNVDKLQKLTAIWSSDMEDLEEEIRIALKQPGDVMVQTGRGKTKQVPLNVNSRQQMLPRLAQLGICPTKIKVTKNPDGSETEEAIPYFGRDGLMRFADKHEVIGKIVQYKRIKKLVSTYTTKLADHAHPDNHRIYPDFNITATTTGRPACSNPNLQQIPVKTREGRIVRATFEAPEGYMYGKADFANIELRLIADYFGDQNMINAFNEHLDLHCLTGAAVLNSITDSAWEVLKPLYEDFYARYKADDFEIGTVRQVAKILNFGLGYGAGPAKLQGIAWREYNIAWTLEQATEYRNLFRVLYPGIYEYQKKRGEVLKRTTGPFIEKTFDGRWRWIDPDSGFSESLNFRIQGSQAEMTKRAHLAVCRDVEVVMAVHDELVFLARENEIQDACEYVKAAMVREGQRFLSRVQCEADYKYGKVWAK